MKTPEPFYGVRIMLDEATSNYIPLGANLEDELSEACKTFLESSSNTLLENARALAIAQQTAISHYLTGIKIQNFAINAAKNDTLKLNEELTVFCKNFDKLTES